MPGPALESADVPIRRPVRIMTMRRCRRCRRSGSTLASGALPARASRFAPDICLIDFYGGEGRMGLHQDKDESAASLSGGRPVVSISLGDTARFLFGGWSGAIRSSRCRWSRETSSSSAAPRGSAITAWRGSSRRRHRQPGLRWPLQSDVPSGLETRSLSAVDPPRDAEAVHDRAEPLRPEGLL